MKTLIEMLRDKPKYWAVFGRHGGWTMDVYDDEIETYRKSLKRQKLRFVEGFATHDDAFGEVHRQVERICKRLNEKRVTK